MYRKTIVMLLVTGCGLFAQSAMSGTIDFFGKSVASRASATGKTTTVTFTNPWRTLGGGTDEYAVIPAGVVTTMKSISFTGTGTTAVLTAPVVPLWKFTFGGQIYSFTLTSLEDAVTTRGSIAMSGEGIASIGSSNAPATWAISGTGTNFTFRLSFITTTAVPDGGSAVVLLGTALVIIEATRRSTLKRKA